MLAPAYINGLTLLGGEPFEPENQRGLLPFLRRVRERLPGKTVWCYTGFTLEALQAEGRADRMRLLEQVDVLVDGPYLARERSLELLYRGSRNQRLIDMKKTREQGQVVLLPEE